MSIYRTLAERPELFRAPRSRKEAGMHGGLDTSRPPAEFVDMLREALEEEQRSTRGLVVTAACGLVGAAILGVFLVLVLGIG